MPPPFPPRPPRVVTPRTRDRYRSGTAMVTGVVAFGAVASSGLAAASFDRQATAENHRKEIAAAKALQAQMDAATAAAAKVPVIVHKTRKHQTITKTTVRRVVVYDAAPRSGGTVQSYGGGGGGGGGATTTSQSSGGGGAHASTPAPPPPPPPPPAPSSGS